MLQYVWTPRTHMWMVNINIFINPGLLLAQINLISLGSTLVETIKNAVHLLPCHLETKSAAYGSHLPCSRMSLTVCQTHTWSSSCSHRCPWSSHGRAQRMPVGPLLFRSKWTSWPLPCGGRRTWLKTRKCIYTSICFHRVNKDILGQVMTSEKECVSSWT